MNTLTKPQALSLIARYAKTRPSARWSRRIESLPLLSREWKTIFCDSIPILEIERHSGGPSLVRSLSSPLP